MPGLPIPLWYHERHRTGGAALGARGGGSTRVVVAVSGGAARGSKGGGSVGLRSTVRGGAVVSFTGGGERFVSTVRSGGARSAFTGGASRHVTVAFTGGAASEFAGGARVVRVAFVVSRRGGAVVAGIGGGAMLTALRVRGGGRMVFTAGGTSVLEETPRARAPRITWGAVRGADPGELLEVFYTIDEPSAVSAELVVGSTIYPLRIDPDAFRANLPEDIAKGPAEVRVLVRDAEGNEAIRTLEIFIGAPPIESGGGRRFTHGPIATRITARVGVAVSLVKPVEIRLGVESQAVRLITARMSLDYALAHHREFRLAAIREPSLRYAKLLNDDEELLLWLDL